MKKYQSFAPRTLFSVRSLAVGLLGSALGCTQAQDISFYLVGKGQNYVQAGTNAPALRVQSPHAFVALTAPTPAGAVLSASLRTPSNAVHQLTLGEYGQLSREQSFTCLL